MAVLFTSPSKPISPILKTTSLAPTPTPSHSIPNPPPPFPALTSKSLTILRKPPRPSPIFTKASAPSSSSTVSETTDFAVEDDGLDGENGELDGEDGGSPWVGAVVYRRDASVTHLEYHTTLERLGLGKLSSGLSRTRASAMGIRLPARKGKDSAMNGEETPVLISIDVTRRKRRLKLDGVVRTVITLGCNRCAEPAAECVFSNFTLLLTEDPVEEPDEINMGVIYGQDKHKTFTEGSNEEDDDEKLIDMDDKLYFPAEEKEIDISKNIRDLLHVEITINAICDASCKGLCLKCGTNLNKSSCNCSKQVAQDKQYGPLKNLREQMQQR